MTPKYDDHPDFNAELDADGAITIAGAVFSRSRILFDLEQETYRLALMDWQRQRQEERREELRTKVQDTLTLRANDTRFKELVKVARNGGLVPFVGAGITKPCKMPMWTEFLILAGIQVGCDAVVTKQRLSLGEYEEVAEELVTKMGPNWFNEHVERTFCQDTPLTGPVLHIPRITDGCVITTNFDDVLERAFTQFGNPFTEKIIGKSQTGFRKALMEKRRYLLKIHGDAKDRRGRVLTIAEYNDAYGGASIDFTRELPKNLKTAFTYSTLLFLGCSLETDRTLKLFKQVVNDEGTDDLARHYAILELPAVNVEERERFLTEHHIFPIWFPPKRFDVAEALVALLAEMATC
ncbi:SIR2 family protein [Corallococcus sp. CA054B]|uniref:SIR2 family protein n=1 Tax=Corallococcus sp. CA054B TaxID=2316734 RepID=UPI000EA04F47|nr:SIR2 family protein [Corallococcus sp. CA054B]RKG68587.1 SIR2 family protein [Corallococcus sp. CA054B]